jgi:hypothetical protein
LTVKQKKSIDDERRHSFVSRIFIYWPHQDFSFHLSSPPVFSWVRVTRSLVLCVMFCTTCLLHFCLTVKQKKSIDDERRHSFDMEGGKRFDVDGAKHITEKV